MSVIQFLYLLLTWLKRANYQSWNHLLISEFHKHFDLADELLYLDRELLYLDRELLYLGGFLYFSNVMLLWLLVWPFIFQIIRSRRKYHILIAIVIFTSMIVSFICDCFHNLRLRNLMFFIQVRFSIVKSFIQVSFFIQDYIILNLLIKFLSFRPAFLIQNFTSHNLIFFNWNLCHHKESYMTFYFIFLGLLTKNKSWIALLSKDYYQFWVLIWSEIVFEWFHHRNCLSSVLYENSLINHFRLFELNQ
jgi:hypothetical protein